MSDLAISKMVNLILKRKGIESFPIPIEKIGNTYADIVIKDIPFDFDGLTYRIDNSKTKIIINSNVSPNRMRFTLAHEIGHVVIPWHTGTIVDNDPGRYFSNTDYSELESEANIFATELLLPSFLIEPVIDKYRSETRLLKDLCIFLSEQSQVSLLATTFRVFHYYDNEYFFVITDVDQNVIYSGKNRKSLTVLPQKNTIFNISLYKENYLIEYIEASGLIYFYLKKKEAKYEEKSHNTNWKEIIEIIFSKVDFSKEESLRCLQRINGIVGSFNSIYGKNINTYNEFRDGLKIRFTGRPDLIWLTSHELFSEYLDRKAMDLFQKKDI